MNLVLAALAAALLCFSQPVMQAARTAAQVFVQGVMPALFPMMVISRLLRSPKRFALMQTALFAFVSGSPAAAQRMHGMKPFIRPESWQPMLCLTGVMSPMFFTGTLAGWLNRPADGWALLLFHWLSAGITAVLWKISAQNREEAAAASTPAQEMETLPGAIGRACQALMSVCGAMMLFSIAAALIRECLAPLVDNEKALALVWAALEVGGGTLALVQSGCSLPLIAAMCSFGGLSIWLQNLLFVGNDIRPAKLLFMRALHGAVCYLLLSGFLKIQNLLIT